MQRPLALVKFVSDGRDIYLDAKVRYKYDPCTTFTKIKITKKMHNANIQFLKDSTHSFGVIQVMCPEVPNDVEFEMI